MRYTQITSRKHIKNVIQNDPVLEIKINQMSYTICLKDADWQNATVCKYKDRYFQIFTQPLPEIKCFNIYIVDDSNNNIVASTEKNSGFSILNDIFVEMFISHNGVLNISTVYDNCGVAVVKFNDLTPEQKIEQILIKLPTDKRIKIIRSIIFKQANSFAIDGKSDKAVLLHSIHNQLIKF